jgi:trimeric autotransporter adhesin
VRLVGLVLIAFACAIPASAAARFRVGASTLWSDTNGWALTTGGAGGQAVPTAADDVTFDANSTVDVTLDVGVAKLCKTLTATNYTHKLTFNVTLTCTPVAADTITLGAGMTFAGTSAFIITGPGSGSTTTFNSNGVTIPIPLTFNSTAGPSSSVWTLTNSVTVTGLLTIGLAGGSPTMTFNGNSITAGGGVTLFQNCGTAGTTTWTFTGGTVQMAGGAGFVPGTSGWHGGAITFNGNVTLSGTIAYINTSVTYTSGTITTTGSLVWFGGDSITMTMNMSGITWNDVAFQAGNDTYTLTSDWNIGGQMIGANGGSPTANFNGVGRNVNVAGNLVTATSGSQTFAGTATLVFNGNTTWSNPGLVRINTTIAGNLTISGTVNYNTGTLKYTSGTITPASGTVSVNANTTFDMAGASLPTLSTVTGGVILTLNSNMGISGGLIFTGTNASPIQIKSNVGGTLRKLTLAASLGITEDVLYANPTDIDSRDGIPVFYAKSTLTNTFNWIGTNPGQAKTGGILIINSGNTPTTSNPGLFIQ